MTTSVHPLAVFLTTDEVCNLFNMLLSNKETQTFTHLTLLLLTKKTGDIVFVFFSFTNINKFYDKNKNKINNELI